MPIRGLTHIVAISGGDADGYALRSDGTVWSWGDNGFHELGTEGTSELGLEALTPVRVDAMSDAVAIAGGSQSLYILRSDGTVWGAGVPFGNDDQSTGVHNPELGRVPGLQGITAVAGGGYGGWALRADGTVLGWGVNGDGAVGDGTRTNRLKTRVRVKGLTHVAALCGIAVGAGCAVRSDGTEWVWGDNRAGTLGNGTIHDRLVPGPIPGLARVLAAAQGGLSGYAVVQP